MPKCSAEECRSEVYANDTVKLEKALDFKVAYGQALSAKRYEAVTTEIMQAGPFYFDEGYHQQYLAKYCALGGTGVWCPIGVGVSA